MKEYQLDLFDGSEAPPNLKTQGTTHKPCGYDVDEALRELKLKLSRIMKEYESTGRIASAIDFADTAQALNRLVVELYGDDK